MKANAAAVAEKPRKTVNRGNGGPTAGLNTAALERKIQLAQERATNVINLAFEKAVAHRENPSKYPLPTGNKSVERAFHELLEAMPKIKRNKIVDKVNETLKAPVATRTGKYKDIVNVDFKSKTAIADQVKTMAVPDSIRFTEAETNELFARVKTRAGVPTKTGGNTLLSKAKAPKNGVPRQAVPAGNLSFFVDSMTCQKPDDVIKDEINLAGFSIDTNGNSVQLAPLFVGKFKKNDTIGLGGNSKLFTLPIDPLLLSQTFTAGLFIIESDWVSNEELLFALFDLCVLISFTISIIILPTFFLLSALAPAAAVPVTIVLGAIGVVSLIVKLLTFVIGDDISIAVSDTLLVENKIEIGEEFARTFTIEKGGGFRGDYSLAARWVGEA